MDEDELFGQTSNNGTPTLITGVEHHTPPLN